MGVLGRILRVGYFFDEIGLAIIGRMSGVYLFFEVSKFVGVITETDKYCILIFDLDLIEFKLIVQF